MTPVEGARRAWLDMGRAGFLSRPVLTAFLVWTIPSALYFDVVAAAGPLGPWLAVSLASALAATGLLLLVGHFARRRWLDGPGPWRAVAMYVAAGALRGMLLWSAAHALGLTTSVGLASRTLQSAVWSAGVMTCASIVVARLAAHRRLMTGIAQRQQALLDLQSTLDQRIRQTRAELIQQVHGELEPTLEQLRSDLDALALSTDSGVDGVIEDFQKAVADVVRPLSRTLAEPVELMPVDMAQPGHSATPHSERIRLADAIRPITSAGLVLLLLLLLAVAVAPESYRNPAVVVRLALLVTFLGLLLKGAQLAATWIRLQVTLPWLLSLLAAAYIVVGLITGLLTRAVTSGLEVPATTFPALAFALTALAPWVVSLAAALQQLARIAELRSAETVSELEVLTAVLRRELWRERRRLALTVHGPIQSALVAAAVTLSRPGFASDDVPTLTATLDQAMAHINRAAGPLPTIDATVRDLASLWTDSATVTFTADSVVTNLVDADEAMRTVVIEILREGVSNAVRHGAADRIDVSITAPASGILRITIEDDGDGAPLSTTPGLGSRMFSEVALDWSLTRHGHTTRLHVELGVELGVEPSSDAIAPA